jgi:sarcosine/dimethylglycine N-methyltransferase
VQLAAVTEEDRVLDAGTGIGGTARMLAAEIGCSVAAVDLTPEFCDTARWLNDVVGLSNRIEVIEADVCELPFASGSFDAVISQHVQMNIAGKARLYAEARRVLAPGGRLALWDVTAGPEQPIRFPVPWAGTAELSHLVTPDELRLLVEEAGFEVAKWNDLTEFGVTAMKAFFSAPPNPLGLHVFVPDFVAKATNLVDNAQHDRHPPDPGRARRAVSPVVQDGISATGVALSRAARPRATVSPPRSSRPRSRSRSAAGQAAVRPVRAGRPARRSGPQPGRRGPRRHS